MTDPRRLLESEVGQSALTADLLLAQEHVPYDVGAGRDRFCATLSALPLGTAGPMGTAVPSSTAGPSGTASSFEAASLQGASVNTLVGKSVAMGLGQGAFWGLGAVAVAGTLLVVGAGLGKQELRDESDASRDAVVGSDRAPEEDVVLAQARSVDEESASFTLSDLEEVRSEQTSVSATSRSNSLGEEVAELRRLRNRVEAEPAQVLAELRTSDFQSHGSLAPEREALAIDALFRLGRTQEAEARAQAFVSAYPEAPASKRLRREGISRPEIHSK